MVAAACQAEPEHAPEAAPTEPIRPPPRTESSVAGSYEATLLVVERPGSIKNLIGEPDTRISLHLNANGITQGQLKIGTDPEFRTKIPLDGRWRLLSPSRVTFDFVWPTFLGEIAFQINASELSGDWVREDTVQVHVTLRRVD